jgi:hypothetical protein
MVPGIREDTQGWKGGGWDKKKKPRAEPIWEDRNSRSGVRAVGSRGSAEPEAVHPHCEIFLV